MLTKKSLGSDRAALLSYEKAVDILARYKTPYLFQNDSVYHAAVVIKKIIEYADKSVVIYDKNLNGDVSDKSDGFLDVLKSAIKDSGKIVRIVIDESTDADSNIKKMISDLVIAYPENIDIRIASKEFKTEVGKVAKALNIGEKIYFTVGDNVSYRLQYPLEHRKADCSFYDPQIATVLLNAFDSAFDTCVQFSTNSK